MVFYGGDDVVLKDKGLHVCQGPPEHEGYGQVLDPGPLQPLPERRSVREAKSQGENNLNREREREGGREGGREGERECVCVCERECVCVCV